MLQQQYNDMHQLMMNYVCSMQYCVCTPMMVYVAAYNFISLTVCHLMISHSMS